MKKLLSILAISALAASAFAQGQVGFINNTAGLVKQWTSATDSTLINVPVGGGFVELLTAPAGTAFTSLGAVNAVGQFAPTYTTLAGFLGANPGWQAISTVGFTTPAAGRFNGGNVALQNAIAGGANAEYLIIGWAGAYPTYDAAIAAAIGGADVFAGSGPMLTTTTGNPGGTPPTTATALSGTFTGMNMALVVVPEPTSFALAGLGLAALLVFRRRS